MQVLGPDQGLGAEYIAGLRLEHDECLLFNATRILRSPEDHHLELAAAAIETVVNSNELTVDLRRVQARALVGATATRLQRVRTTSPVEDRLVQAICEATGTSEIVDNHIHHYETPEMSPVNAGLAVLRGMERVMRRPDLLTLLRPN